MNLFGCEFQAAEQSPDDRAPDSTVLLNVVEEKESTTQQAKDERWMCSGDSLAGEP